MIEAEWWEYEDAGEWADALAGDVQFLIESALEARGDAIVAFPGGSTPGPVLDRLAKAKLAWRDVTIVPTDERLVDVTSDLSNVRALGQRFLPLGARVVPLAAGDLKPEAAGRAADARLADLHWPLDLVWLGMGSDGHTASLFPGADLDAALTSPRRAIGVTPRPLPPDAPVARVTLTAKAIGAARSLVIAITGSEKRDILEQALADGAGSPFPIGRLLAEASQAIDIHWHP
jgi:6-phosphogluconolactonase